MIHLKASIAFPHYKRINSAAIFNEARIAPLRLDELAGKPAPTFVLLDAISEIYAVSGPPP